ncbi:hypothetical protein AB0D65_16530 [Streptomyces griseoloalbus]|uniref:Uncharacterized protein n=1 Tax=Streptomyces griseoloalbus TaxID=67303 RepID=A0ABV3E5X8_9ACTN
MPTRFGQDVAAALIGQPPVLGGVRVGDALQRVLDDVIAAALV